MFYNMLYQICYSASVTNTSDVITALSERLAAHQQNPLQSKCVRRDYVALCLGAILSNGILVH